jgi:repressor LexA
MKKELTPRQQEILNFIRAFHAEKLMPPTLSEIADHFHIRCSSAAYHLETLRRKGRLTRTSVSRSIVLDDQTTAACARKDCLRRLKAMEFDGMDEDGENSIFLSDELLAFCSAENFIAYCIPDDSMFNIGIRQGDIVAVVPVKFKPPLPGDLVLAETPDGRTIVRSYFLYSRKQFQLAPSNSEFKVELYPVSSQVIKGVVVSLCRKFF